MTTARDTFRETGQEVTVRHYLSFQALRTTADFALTEDSMQGIDWRSSGNSAAGNVENITRADAGHGGHLRHPSGSSGNRV